MESHDETELVDQQSGHGEAPVPDIEAQQSIGDHIDSMGDSNQSKADEGRVPESTIEKQRDTSRDKVDIERTPEDLRTQESALDREVLVHYQKETSQDGRVQDRDVEVEGEDNNNNALDEASARDQEQNEKHVESQEQVGASSEVADSRHTNSTTSTTELPTNVIDTEEGGTNCSEEDMSSMGMGSVISSLDGGSTNPSWGQDEEHLRRFANRLRTSQQRALGTWAPATSRGRSHRWDSLEGRAIPPAIQSYYYASQVAAVNYDIESLQEAEEEEEEEPDMMEARSNEASSSEKDDPISSAVGSETTKSTNGTFTHMACDSSKFESYALLVDSTQADRAVEIQLCSMARPHMRAFHMAWMSFFVAFFTWFALTPLLSEIAVSLDLTRAQIWTSSIYGVAGSAVTRILIGPICDKYGARWAMAGTLILSAIPTAAATAVQTSTGLNVVRLFIGIAGSAFVTCQYWTSSMFTREVAGTANALVAGWGNLGGGVTQIVMGSILFPLFDLIYGGEGWTRADSKTDDDLKAEPYSRAADLAWRTACIFPVLLCIIIAVFALKKSDDCPKGNYSKRSREGFMPSVSAHRAIMRGIRNLNTWVLFVHYGCCFGVEITMVNAAALYFKEEFGLSTESAAAIASIFGWMNLFARGVGGFLSDIANAIRGMRGRLWVQVISLLVEGAMVLVFSTTPALAGAIVVMVFFSIFVQAAEGSTYGIVPYVNPEVTGSISGIVGAGGNIGGVAFATVFRQFDDRSAFYAMGWTVMASALLTVAVAIQGHASLCCGADAPEVVQRRDNRAEELGAFPSVVAQDSSHRLSSYGDPDVSRRSSLRDPDTSRRSQLRGDPDGSRRSSRR